VNKTAYYKCATCGTDFGKYPNQKAKDAHFNEHPECIANYSNGITTERGLMPERPIQYYWVDTEGE